MVRVKEMPYSEKCNLVQDSIRLIHTFVPSFVKKHLGDQTVVELQNIWREGIRPVPEDASIEEKYNIAYGNFIWMEKSNFNFIRTHMGEDGITQFKRAEVEALKRKNTGLALFFLNLIRAISPDSAFAMINKKFAYQLQWMTPFSVSELSRERAVFSILRCKILDFQDTDDICLVGCQSVFPNWVAEQFKVRMEFVRQGNSCTCTITPLVQI
jgi:hypothetical protein